MNKQTIYLILVSFLCVTKTTKRVSSQPTNRYDKRQLDNIQSLLKVFTPCILYIIRHPVMHKKPDDKIKNACYVTNVNIIFTSLLHNTSQDYSKLSVLPIDLDRGNLSILYPQMYAMRYRQVCYAEILLTLAIEFTHATVESRTINFSLIDTNIQRQNKLYPANYIFIPIRAPYMIKNKVSIYTGILTSSVIILLDIGNKSSYLVCFDRTQVVQRIYKGNNQMSILEAVVVRLKEVSSNFWDLHQLNIFTSTEKIQNYNKNYRVQNCVLFKKIQGCAQVA